MQTITLFAVCMCFYFFTCTSTKIKVVGTYPIRTTTDHYTLKSSSYKSAYLAHQRFCGDHAKPYSLTRVFVCVWNSWIKRLMLHCQMSQVVHPSGEINWLSLKQEVCRQELQHMVRIRQLETTVSPLFWLFSLGSGQHLDDECVFV